MPVAIESLETLHSEPDRTVNADVLRIPGRNEELTWPFHEVNLLSLQQLIDSYPKVARTLDEPLAALHEAISLCAGEEEPDPILGGVTAL